MMKTDFGIDFANSTQEIFFNDFYNFLYTLNIEISIYNKDNAAYICVKDGFARVKIFPYDQEGLHFEFSLNPNKDFNSDNSMPFFCNSNDDLLTAELISRILLLMNFDKDPAFKEKESNTSQAKEVQNVKTQLEYQGNIKDRLIWSYF